MANVINSATADTAVNMNSVDSLGFSTEEPFIRSSLTNDQPHDEQTTTGSKPIRGWKLMKKRISHALRTLFSCSLPTP
ncbi:hypothetical protein A6R68_03735, partial [Neotoma lepida]